MPNDNFDMTFIGQQKDEWVHGCDYARIHYRGLHWELEVGIKNMRKSDEDAIVKGDFICTFAVVDGILFWLIQFGNAFLFEAPYEPRLHKQKIDFVSFPAGKGAPLIIEAIESTSGILKNDRLIGLGNIFSNNIHKVCRELQEQPFEGSEQYHCRLDRVYAQYTTEQLFRFAKRENIFAVARR